MTAMLVACGVMSRSADAAFTTPWEATSAWNAPHVAPTGKSYAAPVLADVNNDTLPDLLIGSYDGNVYVFFNTGSSSAPSWPSTPSITIPALNPGSTGGMAVPAVADLDGDGDLDVLVGNRGQGVPTTPAVVAYENTGTASSPSWTRNSAWDVTGLASNGYYAPALADLNNNGNIDLLLGNSTGDLKGYELVGTTWTRMSSLDLFSVGAESTPALADLDGDGDYDLMVGEALGTVFAFKNVGTASSPSWSAMGSWFVPDPDTATKNFANPALADLDGDGKIDLMYGDSSGVAFGYKNTGLPPTEPGTAPPPPPPGIHTVTETFDGFTCSGSWKLDPDGPNNSYIRDCGNGWTAYALDASNTNQTPPWNPGPVGSDNVVTLDSVNGPSAVSPSSPPLGAANLAMAPPDTALGELWLFKSFPVVPGQAIQTLKSDYRLQVDASYSTYVGMIVFDGTLARPPSTYAYSQGVPQNANVLASDLTFEGASCGANIWCPWHTADLGAKGIYPAQSSITVAFKVTDARTTQNVMGDVDNVTVSGVVTPSQSSVPVGDIAQLWKATYTASGTSNGAEPAAVAIDASGNVYVAGSTYNGSNFDILTVKYDPSGSPVWTQTYDGGDADQAVGLSLDTAGNVYVTGRSFQGGSNNFVALKYSNSGTQQWTPPTYDNGGNDDQPVAQALDGSGNLYVTGTSCAGSQCDYATVVYNSSGVQQWAMLYDDAGGGTDHAVGIGVDGSGNAYVTGTSADPASPGVDDIATVKYNSSGQQQWVKRVANGSDSRAVAIAVDGAGDSYVTGWDYRGTGTGTPSIVTVKYATGGSQLWAKSYDDGNTDMPVSMALDGAGNVYITGKSGDVTDYDIITLKYLADGSGAWGRSYGTAGLNDLPAKVAVDGSGNVYVAGMVTRSTGNTDFVTLRYDASGNAKNAITYDGYGLKDTPIALALGVDGQGDTVPVVTGTSLGADGRNHISTARYEKALPDLTMSSLTAPTSGTVGSTIDIDNTVENIDDLAAKKHADSGAFDVTLYLAPDVGGAPEFAGMIPLQTRSVTNLAPGQSSAATTTVTIPSSVAEGTYYVVAVADSGDAVTEQDETNNRLVASTTIGIQGNTPDLVVSSVDAPATATHGSSFDVTVSVTDIVSTGTSTSFYVGIYASNDATITSADTELTSYQVSGGLAGFATNTQTISVTVPNSGTYYIGAIVDSTNVVTEVNESNNSGVNLSGTALSTRLVTDSDFLPGLSVSGTSGVSVLGSGNGARVTLAKAVAWSAAPSSWNLPDIGGYAKPALGDLNGDGVLDVIIGDSTGLLHAYENKGTVSSPVWDTQNPAPLGWNISSACTVGGSTGSYASPVLVDLDGDGDLDLMVGNRYGVCAYQNTGTASSPSWTRHSAWDITGLAASGYYDPAAGDLDGDGKVDILLGSSGGTISAYRNTGTTSSPVWTLVTSSWNPPNPSVSYSSPALADLDGDGKLDLMVGDRNGNMTGYRNTGTPSAPSWTAANSSWNISTGQSFVGPALADLDGDGDIDVLYGNQSGVSSGYQNTGGYTTTSGTYFSKVVDAGTHGGFTTLSYTSSVPAGTTLTVDVRAGDSTTAGDSTWSGWLTSVADGADISSLDTQCTTCQYVQYRAHLATTNTANTSALFGIEAGTQPPPPQDTVVSVVSGSGGSGGGGLGVLDLLAMAFAAGVGRVARGRRGISGR